MQNMLKFYRTAVFGILALIVFTFSFLYLGFIESKLDTSLFPDRDPDFLWKASIEPEIPVSKTHLLVKKETEIVEYEFFLHQEEEKPYPYSHYAIYFLNQLKSFLQVDLRSYKGITFDIQCDPKNVLLFGILSFDDKVTTFTDLPSRRVSSTAFSCSNRWTRVSIDFDKLITPSWWLSTYGFELSDGGYRLDKALGFLWINSSQSPLDISSHVKLTNVKLVGNDVRFIYAATVISFLSWVIFAVWLIRLYTRALTADIRERIESAQPSIDYKKLSIEPQKEKEKNSILRYIATEYANPELSLEMAVAALGINRNKINDLLKDELGLTFSAYLNSLRLKEAARLLAENDDINVSIIAYLVGYNNPSYFNKLFKLQYNCAPMVFKSLCQQKNTSADF